MNEEELKKLLTELNIFVDFGHGDKFKVEIGEIDLENKRLILKGSQGQVRWIKIDERYGNDKRQS